MKKSNITLGTFFQLGGRGADEWANDLEEYMRICNDRVKVLPQCETREALENIDEIMSVPGVDGIFIGPYDLSIDLGIPGKMDSPVLSDAIARILQACEKYGKASYIYAGSMEAAARWAEMGSPVYAVAWLANQLTEYGEYLKKGDVILSGASMYADAAQAGDQYVITLDGFPSLSVKFE